MSADQDRITVPTNGKGPHTVPVPVPMDVSTAGAPTEEEMSVAFTPRQLAIGFGVIASLVLLVIGLVRRRPTDA